MMQQLGLIEADATSSSGFRSTAPEGMEGLVPTLNANGEPVGFLLNAEAFQASEEDFAPPSVANPLSVSRVQSAYTAGDAISNTLIITFTVTNNQPPSVMPDLPVTATMTDTMAAISAIDFSQDPNVIRNVLLTDALLPDNATFLSADPMSDRHGDDLAWNLGDVPPLGILTATLRVQAPTDVVTFTDLDTGATAWGTLQGRAVSASTAPARLSPNEFAQWLVWTVDANYYDEYMVQKAAELGNEWQAMFEYVRSLGYESYKGSLRGTRGTLWSEAGNSLDQSSLLIAMLRGSGIPARYRHGTLSTGTAQSLILSMFPEPKGVIGHIPAGTEVADPANDPQLLAETVDHWWVEAYLPGVGWVNLDPCFATARSGQGFYEALLSDGTDKIAEAPDALRHKVTMTVKVEHYHPLYTSRSKLEYSYPLSHTFNTVELVGASVTLGHVVNSSQVAGFTFWRVQHSYTPYFLVRDFESVIGGNTFAEMLSNFPFGTFVITGEWLLFDVLDANGNVTCYEREVVDRIGFVARQNSGTLDISDNIRREPIVNDMDIFTVVLNLGTNEHYNQKNSLSTIEQFVRLGEQWPNPYLIPSLAIPGQQQARHELWSMLKNGASALGTSFYTISGFNKLIDELMLVKRYITTPQLGVIAIQIQDESTTHVSIDLLNNKTISFAYPGQNMEMQQFNQFLTGVLDSAFESLVFPKTVASRSNGLLEVFAAAKEQNIEIVELTLDSVNQLTTIVNLSTEATTRIHNALVNGKHIITPRHMVSLDTNKTVMWLEIDPATGETISNSESGLHLFEEWGTLHAHICGVMLIAFGWIQGYVVATDVMGDYQVILNINRDNFWDVVASVGELFLILVGCVAGDALVLVKAGGPAATGLIVFGAFLGIATRIFLKLSGIVDPPLPVFWTKTIRDTLLPASITMYSLNTATLTSSLLLTTTMLTNFVSAKGSFQLISHYTEMDNLEAYTLTTGNSHLLDCFGGVLDVGKVAAEFKEIVMPTTFNSSNTELWVTGTSRLSFYAPALPGLAAGTDWLTYTAELTSTQPYTLMLTDAVVTVNDTDVYTGNFTLVVTGTTVLTGSGHTAAPNFAEAAFMQTQDAQITLGPSQDSILVGGEALSITNGLALAGYTGPVTITEETSDLDRVELDGAADFFTLNLTPESAVTDPVTPITFQVEVMSNFSDTYTTTVEAPRGWNVALDANGVVTATPPLGAQPGAYTLLVTVQSGAYPDLFLAAEHTVTVTPYQGMESDVAYDTLITVPTGEIASPPTGGDGRGGAARRHQRRAHAGAPGRLHGGQHQYLHHVAHLRH